jgi:threonyl-tRNA synthetase
MTKEISDSGFFIEVKVEKNISEKQLPLFEGKLLKLLSKNPEQDVSVLDAKDIKFLKLRGVSGAEAEEGIVNRIFGFATLTKEHFDKRLEEIEEAESRDHRRIGKDLELFMIDEMVGKGLPI